MISLSRRKIIGIARQMIMDGRLDSAFVREAEKNKCSPAEIKRQILSLSDVDMVNIIEKHIGSFGGMFEWKK